MGCRGLDRGCFSLVWGFRQRHAKWWGAGLAPTPSSPKSLQDCVCVVGLAAEPSGEAADWLELDSALLIRLAQKSLTESLTGGDPAPASRQPCLPTHTPFSCSKPQFPSQPWVGVGHHVRLPSLL